MAEAVHGLDHALAGDRLLAQGQFAEAFEAYASALKAQPHNVYWRFLAGESLFHLGRYADTVTLLHDLDPGADTALAIELALTLGRALQLTGHTTAAEMQLIKAFMLDPGHEEAAYNLGVFYEQAGLPEQAINFLQAAAQRHPQSVRLHYNLGSCLAQCGQTAAAEFALLATVALQPDHVDAHHNLALLCLRQGNLTQGWHHYAWRFNRHATEGAPAHWVPRTSELPADLHGHTVRVQGEQGIGDELFFMRYLPALRARGAQVQYQLCNAKLAPLLGQPALASLVQASNSDTPASFRLLVGDLPRALGGALTHAYPAAVPLQAPTTVRTGLQQQYPLLASPRRKLGLAWRAGTQAQPQGFATQRWLQKTAPLNSLLDVLAPLDVEVVVLQRGLQPEEWAQVQARLGADRVLDASRCDQNLDELLALLSCLDGLVGVSNTNVHLCAGLGIGGDVLVPAPAEFRWQEEGSPSPWFPGFAVHRQSVGADWQAPMDTLAASLRARYGVAQRQ